MYEVHEFKKHQKTKVIPGDQFRLYVKGKLVHSVDIESAMTITHWAVVTLKGVGMAYFIGNEKLEAELAKRKRS
jgi:NifB/MoaA-like Fe-S oxidoreductase